jgi:hypothetical protein
MISRLFRFHSGEIPPRRPHPSRDLNSRAAASSQRKKGEIEALSSREDSHIV